MVVALVCELKSAAALFMYDGPSVKEKINLDLFSLPFIGRENKLGFIVTPVYWGEKINLNSFSIPFIREIKEI